jgi:hypothetical protein
MNHHLCTIENDEKGTVVAIIGICGDNCAYCPRYIATQKGGIQELENVKELWLRLGLRDPAFPVQNMVCKGCMPENRCAYPEICSCVSEKAIENCGLCDEYPCELIKGAFNRSDKLKSHAAKVCTQEEMEMLQKAFFSKREYFDGIHQKHQNNVLK